MNKYPVPIPVITILSLQIVTDINTAYEKAIPVGKSKISQVFFITVYNNRS